MLVEASRSAGASAWGMRSSFVCSVEAEAMLCVWGWLGCSISGLLGLVEQTCMDFIWPNISWGMFSVINLMWNILRWRNSLQKCYLICSCAFIHLDFFFSLLSCWICLFHLLFSFYFFPLKVSIEGTRWIISILSADYIRDLFTSLAVVERNAFRLEKKDMVSAGPQVFKLLQMFDILFFIHNKEWIMPL